MGRKVQAESQVYSPETVIIVQHPDDTCSRKIRHLVSPVMPFANLSDTHKSRWGDERTAEKMRECVWLRPEAVAQMEFFEWTAGDRLRHSKFGGLREGKDPRSVVKEPFGELRWK